MTRQADQPPSTATRHQHRRSQGMPLTAAGPSLGTGRCRKTFARRRRVLAVTPWAAAGAVVLGGIGPRASSYFKLNGNIYARRHQRRARHGPAAVDADNGSMDILVLGSDSRSGANARVRQRRRQRPLGHRDDRARLQGPQEGQRGLHTPRHPRRAPRLHQATAAARPPAARQAMFNSAYEAGGPACAVKTVGVDVRASGWTTTSRSTSPASRS